VGQQIEIGLADLETANRALPVVQEAMADLDWKIVPDGTAFKLVATFKPPALRQIEDNALKQNITTLHNRVNQLGTSEPVIQQQGADRIVVELPGVQDTARAKDIIGRTATLEARLVDSGPEALTAAAAGTVPFGDERFVDANGIPILVKKEVVFSGDNLTDAQPNVDGQTQEPVVNLNLDAKGARVVRDVSRDNIGQRMALILFEKGKGSVITAPVIRGELGARFQISGAMTPEVAADTALLLRSGALAAPMDIIEERTVGPSLGADNIARGFLSTVYGFLAITIFMVIYYVLFGLVSVVALASNLLLLVALLSALQATLTLPGMAAIALTLGMAIDSNVLINERIREELRNGTPPQAAINSGYERAFGTILDSNITTLIAGLSLLAFGSGPVRGFAVVHCLGIVTSIFSSVFVSRGIVNLIYGKRKKLAGLAIGQVWKAA
jgi:preprotein translocase subunit SecD